MHPESQTTWFHLKTRIQAWIRGLSADKSANPQPTKPVDAPAKRKSSAPSHLAVNLQESTNNCHICGSDDHPTSTCSSLAQMDMTMKLNTIRKNFLCVHCLEKGHIGKECGNVPSCAICRGKHNTLLHGRPRLDFRRQRSEEGVSDGSDSSEDPVPPVTPRVVDADTSTGNWASSGETEAS